MLTGLVCFFIIGSRFRKKRCWGCCGSEYGIFSSKRWGYLSGRICCLPYGASLMLYAGSDEMGFMQFVGSKTARRQPIMRIFGADIEDSSSLTVMALLA
jgi:hypothetical protein